MTRNHEVKLYVNLLLVTILAVSVSAGCQVSPETVEVDQIPSELEGNEGDDFDLETRDRVVMEGTTEWPDGWMVVHQEEWIPILDELGRRLHEARSAFVRGDQGATVDNIRRGILFLEAQVDESSERDRAALSTAIAMLRAIMSRFSGGEEVTLVQLDIAFANAYFSDLEREALGVETGSAVPYLEQPDRQLQLAMERFLENDSEAAARETDRAAAYLYLEGNRLGLRERAELNEAAQDLERLAARIRILEIRDREELETVFEPARRTWRQHAVAPARPPTLGLMSR